MLKSFVLPGHQRGHSMAARAILLLLAFGFIKSRKYVVHGTTMILAVITSAVFLACYLTYHTLRRRRGIVLTRFPQSPIRPDDVALLSSHTILAVVILPLILITLWHAYRRNWAVHRRFSVWTTGHCGSMFR